MITDTLVHERAVLTVAETQYSLRNENAPLDEAGLDVKAQEMLKAEKTLDALEKSGLTVVSV